MLAGVDPYPSAQPGRTLPRYQKEVPMFVIRDIAIAKAGRRSEAVGLYKEFLAEAQKELGHPKSRIYTASIGQPDSTVMSESEVESLSVFEEQIAKINSWSRMEHYGKRFSELFVDGSHRFEVYRVVE